MDPRTSLTLAVVAGMLMMIGRAAAPAHAVHLGTAFTYQGQLQLSGAPADGPCDFQFALYDAAAGGAQLGTTQTLTTIGVTDGLFTVQLNEGGQFGADAFVGEQRWLQIGVRCPAGTGGYTALSPRQQLTATPYARYAPAAGSAPWSGLTGVPPGFSDGTDNDSLGALSCANGQVAKRSGGSWVCAADDNTTYSAGTGLVLSGNQFSVNFGTSANTVAAGNHTHGGQQWTASQSYGLLVNDTALNGTAVIGTASGGGSGAVGVAGGSGNGVGVFGSSTASVGVKGLSGDPSTIVPPVAAVWGDSHTNAGVIGTSDDFVGIRGESTNGTGVYGFTQQGLYGVFGESAGGSGYGVSGRANGANAWGVYGESDSGKGVRGRSFSGVGVNGKSENGAGVLGESDSSAGVQGISPAYDAVRGESAGSGRSGVYGVNSHADGYGVFGRNSNRGTTGYLGGGYGVQGTRGVHSGYLGTGDSGVLGMDEQTNNYGVLGGTGHAGYFSGKVQVDGDLSVLAGYTKNFKIDHPLDAAHKYLNHFSVESNEVTNVYHGIVVLDAHGEAEVALPAWFDAVNRDARYQLTCIGRFAPVYVAEEITDNRFKIAGGVPGLKVSWQVTAIRNDPSIRRHAHPVEEDKPPKEQGTYLDPEAYGQGAEKSAEWVQHPEVMRRLQAARARSVPVDE
jgi:hypothetical protein